MIIEIIDGFMRNTAIDKDANAVNGLVTSIDVPENKNRGPYTINYIHLAEDTKSAEGKESMESDFNMSCDGAKSCVAKALNAEQYNFAISF